MNAAAIILCAGKGTRMNDNSQNKVCFDCAGIPTLKRIVFNMKEAGVSRFVIVIGHQAYSVMDCLDGEDGIVYAYQKEQKGTGHAAMCGLKALQTVGYKGPVIISFYRSPRSFLRVPYPSYKFQGIFPFPARKIRIFR